MDLKALEGQIPISVERAAALFDVTDKTVRTWIRGGLPVLKSGKKGSGNGALIDLVELIPWYLQENALDVAKTRLASAQAEKHEMENAVRRGELLDAQRLGPDIETALTVFRQRMLRTPTKLAPLVNPENPNLARDLIAAELHRILNELAKHFADATDGDAREPAPDAGAEDPAAAAVADGEPVGGSVPAAKRRVKRRARAVQH